MSANNEKNTVALPKLALLPNSSSSSSNSSNNTFIRPANRIKTTPTENVDLKDMRIDNYSDLSFVLRGEGTRIMQIKIEGLGGKWNKNLKGGGGYIFSNNKKEEITSWLQDVLDGKILADDIQAIRAVHEARKNRRKQMGGMNNMKMISGPTYPQYSRGMEPSYRPENPNMQLINWTLYRPTFGQTVHLNVRPSEGSNITSEYSVTKTESHNGAVDTVLIVPKDSDNQDEVSKLVICNGHWQVWGYTETHSIYFK